MLEEITFYYIRPKPPATGAAAYAAALAGKRGRGRQWFRLDAGPGDVYLFPEGTTADAVRGWVDGAGIQANAFACGDDLHMLQESEPRAVANAIRCHLNGRSGWVVFNTDHN